MSSVLLRSAPLARARTTATADALTRLAWLVAALALVAAAAGLLWPNGADTIVATTARGERVETYGRGVYAHDSVFRGAGFRGSDAVTLLLGVPFLLVTAALHRRGSLRGTILLAGGLAYFLYTYASVALSAAYNDLFLLYVALLAAAAFAFALAVRATDGVRLDPRALPRRSLGIFMLASGVVTASIWLLPEVLPALIERSTPTLEGYTTLVTHVLDLALIVPTVFLSGTLILRGSRVGYVLAVPLLVLEASLLPIIVAQTASQLEAGVEFTIAEIAGPIASFCVFASLAAAFLVVLVRHVDAGAERHRQARSTR